MPDYIISDKTPKKPLQVRLALGDYCDGLQLPTLYVAGEAILHLEPSGRVKLHTLNSITCKALAMQGLIISAYDTIAVET